MQKKEKQNKEKKKEERQNKKKSKQKLRLFVQHHILRKKTLTIRSFIIFEEKISFITGLREIIGKAFYQTVNLKNWK